MDNDKTMNEKVEAAKKAAEEAQKVIEEDVKHRLESFNKEMEALAKKYNCKIGAEAYVHQGRILARVLVMPAE